MLPGTRRAFLTLFFYFPNYIPIHQYPLKCSGGKLNFRGAVFRLVNEAEQFHTARLHVLRLGVSTVCLVPLCGLLSCVTCMR